MKIFRLRHLKRDNKIGKTGTGGLLVVLTDKCHSVAI
jgi:hypothetical protein